MEIRAKLLTFLIFSFASAVFAEDFKTINGKEYKDATVSHVEPDGIVLKTKSGIAKVYFIELPKEVQQRFNYDPQKAGAYSTEQAANYAATQNQQQKQLEENQHQQDAVAAQNMAKSGQLQATWNRSRELQDRYMVLQQQEDALLQQIGEAQKPGPGYWVRGVLHHHPNPEKSQIPLLKSRLQEVSREKRQVAEQLNKPQR
jgi:hypothetical protein